jgi:hypothetical protein
VRLEEGERIVPSALEQLFSEGQLLFLDPAEVIA